MRRQPARHTPRPAPLGSLMCKLTTCSPRLVVRFLGILYLAQPLPHPVSLWSSLDPWPLMHWLGLPPSLPLSPLPAFLPLPPPLHASLPPSLPPSLSPALPGYAFASGHPVLQAVDYLAEDPENRDEFREVREAVRVRRAQSPSSCLCGFRCSRGAFFFPWLCPASSALHASQCEDGFQRYTWFPCFHRQPGKATSGGARCSPCSACWCRCGAWGWQGRRARGPRWPGRRPRPPGRRAHPRRPGGCSTSPA